MFVVKLRGAGWIAVTVSQPMDDTEVLRVVLPCKGEERVCFECGIANRTDLVAKLYLKR